MNEKKAVWEVSPLEGEHVCAECARLKAECARLQAELVEVKGELQARESYHKSTLRALGVTQQEAYEAMLRMDEFYRGFSQAKRFGGGDE